MNVNDEALKMHKDNQGKLAMISKVPLKDCHDLSLAYTPGVAEPCRKIHENKDLSFDYTCRGNMVAVVSDGTRVLGLGNIGPEAAMPVMEGKCVLFKVFGDIDAVPICLAVTDASKFIETVKYLQPSFAGINLEDIESPKCYDIEDALKQEMDIPVFHDDQHGTAIALVSAVIGALRFVKKEIAKVRIVVNGPGAAGTAIVKMLLSAGATDVMMMNSKGAMYEGMDATQLDAPIDRVQLAILKRINRNKQQGKLADIVKGADILIGVSAPNVFTPEIIKSMNTDAIVFAMANPVPEISYKAAKAAGARVAGTGRSDSPNQVNNVNVFPGLFRGAIDVRAREINEAMKLAAVHAIANLIHENELREDYIVPGAFDIRVAPAVAAAVARAAIETGVARITIDPEEVRANAIARIKR